MVSWIPAYEAAKALIEMRGSAEPVLHLVNPNPQPWSTVFGVIAKELHVPLVPYPTWLAALDADSKDPSMTQAEHVKRNPALRLLDWFKNVKPAEDREPLDNVRLSAVKSSRVVPWLNEVHIEGPMIKKWLGAWRESGYLPQEPLDNLVEASQESRARPKL